MILLYDILLHITLVLTAPYFVFKMLTVHKYRDGLLERFGLYKAGTLAPVAGGRAVWFHAISVGETKAALPVLRLFKKTHPDVRVVFSTVTQTGRRVAEQEARGLIDALIYFPLDLSWVVKAVIRKVRPTAFITVEKDIWPNAFLRLNAAGVPVFVVNGTMSERSTARFKRFGFFFKGVFRAVSAYCARTPEDRQRAVDAGVREDRAFSTGNIKFDISAPAVDKAASDALAASLGIRPGDIVITAGSTHAGEEEIILRVFKALLQNRPDLRLVIAPRHPERWGEVDSLIKKTGIYYGKRSSGTTGACVMLDTMGELMAVWSFTDIAFVGGSIVPGIGGHNLLEPAFFSRPVVYGARLTSYLGMAEMLEAAGGGIRAADEAGLAKAFETLLADEEARLRMGEAARSVVEANRGAAARSVEIIGRYMRGA
ncbi:MAG: 3-deoxy-D-manno-octulosonic acid transferase [Deltaproteobacteria bacterium]|nr:3-deoxy-D-manno-octulosonic acid transferase [Deltaproteobacteria bacterium]